MLASMSRQPCHGSCPVYEFTIYEDGRMEYLGWGYVKTRNRASTQLDAATLDAVRRAFRDAAFFSLGDYARRKGDQTDGPGIMLYYAAEGRACLVKHYLRTSRLPPRQLDVLEATLEALVGIEGFIGTPEERRALNE